MLQHSHIPDVNNGTKLIQTDTVLTAEKGDTNRDNKGEVRLKQPEWLIYSPKGITVT
jgi:hypothetical protein